MIIVDLDNCVADDEHRIKHIQWQHTDPMRRYHDYHMLAAWDNVGNIDIALSDEPRSIFTARPIMFRAMTEEWLRRKRIEYTALIMRNNDDHRPSEQVKEGMLLMLLSHYGVNKADIRKAYDDRPEIIAMYERHGIRAELRRIHNDDAYRLSLPSPPPQTAQEAKDDWDAVESQIGLEPK